MITQAELKQLYHYCPDRGIFIRLFDGKIIIDRNSRGYLRLTIRGKKYYQHRMAVLYMTGELPEEVDHRRGHDKGNTWNNLRPATRLENARNMHVPLNNTSGIKGVSYHARKDKYRAYITVQGRQHWLGYYTTKEAAAEAYSNAAARLFGEFAYTGIERSTRSIRP